MKFQVKKNFANIFLPIGAKNRESSLPHVSINYSETAMNFCMCDHFLWWLFNVSWPEYIYIVHSLWFLVWKAIAIAFFRMGKQQTWKLICSVGYFSGSHSLSLNVDWKFMRVSMESLRLLWMLPAHIKIITTLCCPHMCAPHNFHLILILIINYGEMDGFTTDFWPCRTVKNVF